MKKSQLKEIIRKEITNIKENEIDPYEVAKALIGTEARNKVYSSFGVDKYDYELNDQIRKEVEHLVNLGW